MEQILSKILYPWAFNMYNSLACEAPCSLSVKLGYWTRRTCSACSAMIGFWSNKPLDMATSYWQSLRTSTSFWEREDFTGLGMWSVLVVQSEQHVIYRLMAGGGRKNKANTEETDGERLPWVEAHGSWPPKKGAPGDQVWDLLCVQLASYLEGGPLMSTFIKKNDYDDMVWIFYQNKNVPKWLNCVDRGVKHRYIMFCPFCHVMAKETNAL